MENEVIRSKVKEILNQITGVDPDVISLEDKVGSQLGLDSLDIVEFTLQLEEEFGLEIPDEALEKDVTVNQVIEYIEGRLSQKA